MGNTVSADCSKVFDVSRRFSGVSSLYLLQTGVPEIRLGVIISVTFKSKYGTGIFLSSK